MMAAEFRQRCEDTVLLAVRMQDGTTSQGMWASCRSRKRPGIDSPLESPEGTQPCQHLDLSPIRTITDF